MLQQNAGTVPSGDVRPFSADGDGTMLGEGIGTVVLKRREDAERDGDRIYAVIKSVGTSSDGKGSAIYAPSPDGQARCIRDAHEQAGVEPRSIQLIEAHGTGTKAGDACELNGLHQVFGDADHPWCALGSVKSQIGHTKAAAGMAGLIKATMALHHKVLPPTAKVDGPNPVAANEQFPLYVNGEKRPWLKGETPRRAGVSAFGFGGSNFHAILEEHGDARAQVDWDDDIAIVAYCGDSAQVAQQLSQAPREWSQFIHHAAASRTAFNHGAAQRVIIVATPDNFIERLDRAQQELTKRKLRLPYQGFMPELAMLLVILLLCIQAKVASSLVCYVTGPAVFQKHLKPFS